jgi:proteasome-associated ATPase
VIVGSWSAAEAAAQVRFLEEEVLLLRRKLTESPRDVGVLEQRLAESASRLAQLSTRNEKQLTRTLSEVRGQLVAPHQEVDRLAQPPVAEFLRLASAEPVEAGATGGGRG